MKRISFVLDDRLDALLENERRRRDVSVAAVIREALAAYLTGGEQRCPLPFIGLGRSGQHDTARRIDEILDQEWNAARGR